MGYFQLYNYDVRIAQCFDEETGEIYDSELLEKLFEEKEKALEGIALYHKDLLAQAKAVKEIADEYKKRADNLKERAEKAKQTLNKALAGEKLKTENVNCYYHRSKSTSVVPGTLLPDEYMKFEEPKYNLEKIKKAIESGIELEGCSINDNTNLVIR